jgi:uncharacterized protein (DUF302 family)
VILKSKSSNALKHVVSYQRWKLELNGEQSKARRMEFMMQQSGISVGYGYGRTLDLPFDVAVQRARDSLKSQGFGVLCEIDIKEKLKEKLGVDFANYIILGACNPPLAHHALQQEMNIGLLLPCNVVVYEKDSKSFVGAIDAAKMLSVVGNPALEDTANQVNEKLRRVIDSL